MPKLVDHDERREELATALWRLVTREGVEAASLRRVAAEAGWSSGSLRHYFATQSELLSFAMELVTRRVADRVAALPRAHGMVAQAEQLLAQVLPLDGDRRVEMQVWLAFSMRAAVDPALRPLRDESHQRLRELCVDIAQALGAADATLEGERLHALVDGLALHGVLTPDLAPPALQSAVLSDHLRALSAPRD